VLDGLGWVDAEVRRFDVCAAGRRLRLPHMGWNDVAPVYAKGLFAGLGDDIRFYFLHSYYVAPENSGNVLATTDYGGRFACSVGHRNVYGVQFHPEKSHQWGIKLLSNFAEL
jgi:glutamine amidotransferase